MHSKSVDYTENGYEYVNPLIKSVEIHQKKRPTTNKWQLNFFFSLSKWAFYRHMVQREQSFYLHNSIQWWGNHYLLLGLTMYSLPEDIFVLPKKLPIYSVYSCTIKIVIEAINQCHVLNN